MSSTVINYVQPITQPLEGLYTAFTQMASQHRDLNDRLRSHKNDLLSNSFAFKGSGATAFAGMVDHYLDASEKHMKAFDDAASAVQTCHSTITIASNSADAAGLNDALVNHILDQVSHNDIIQLGSAAIQAPINDMKSTLDNMSSTDDDLWGNLIHFHFGAAFGDLLQEGRDAKRMLGDMWNLLLQAEHILGQWAESVWDAIKKCLAIIWTAVKNVANFLDPLWNGITGVISSGAEFIKSEVEGLDKETGKILPKIADMLDKGGKFLPFVGVLIHVIDRQDNTLEKFFADVNGTLISGLPIVDIVSATSDAESVVMQEAGWGQQHLIAPWLAGGNPTLEKELGEPGAALNKDAQGISLDNVFTDLGGVAYDMDIFGERGDVQSYHQLSHDIMHNPQNLPQDLLHVGLEEVGVSVGLDTQVGQSQGFDRNPGAALRDMKKAGKDLLGSLVSTGASESDLAITGLEDVAVKSGEPPSWIALIHQTWQREHQPIERFRDWLAR
jgi:hypothetical protein